VRILPVGEGHLPAAAAIGEQLKAAGYRVDIGEPTETIGKRIRGSELEKIPFTIVFGDRESEASLAIRERGGEQTEESLADFLAKLATLDS
jgi:threonyl-tRNA synthetase